MLVQPVLSSLLQSWCLWAPNQICDYVQGWLYGSPWEAPVFKACGAFETPVARDADPGISTINPLQTEQTVNYLSHGLGPMSYVCPWTSQFTLSLNSWYLGNVTCYAALY